MTAQAEFDEKYISSIELCDVLGVTRATLMNGYRRGALPEPMRIKRPGGTTHVMLWVREEITSHVAKWKATLDGARVAA